MKTIEELQTLLDAQKQENLESKQMILELNENIDATNRKIRKMESDKTGDMREIANLRTNHTVLTNDYTTLRRELNLLSNVVAEHLATIENLKKTSDEKTEQIRALKQQLTEKHNTGKQQQQQMTALEQRLAEERDNSKQQMTALEQRLAEERDNSKQQMTALEQRLREEIRKSGQELSQLVHHLEASDQSLIAQKHESEQEIKRLSKENKRMLDALTTVREGMLSLDKKSDSDKAGARRITPPHSREDTYRLFSTTQDKRKRTAIETTAEAGAEAGAGAR